MSALQKQIIDNEVLSQASEFGYSTVLPNDRGRSPICRNLARKHLYKCLHNEIKFEDRSNTSVGSITQSRVDKGNSCQWL